MGKPPKTAFEFRFEARLAFLDGRTKRARLLNKTADALDRLARKTSAKAA